MPQSLFGSMLMGRPYQIAIAALSILLFIVETVPLELQRRIVKAATAGTSYHLVLLLVAAYLALVTAQGLTKLGLDLYRGWIGEVAIRWLRRSVLVESTHTDDLLPESFAEGVTFYPPSRTEPVVGFVGTSISEPLLQVGILAAVAAPDGAGHCHHLFPADRLCPLHTSGHQSPD